MHDVIVIGGGPAGLYSAFLLARQGWDVVLFEEHPSAGDPVHCTGVFAADAFGQFDLPRDSVLNPLSHVQFFAPSGETVAYRTPTVEALVIDRRLFDQQLHGLARSSGAALISGARVTDVTVGDSRVSVSFRNHPKAHARAVVLACGANYVLQRRLGLGLPTVFLQSAQIEVPAARIESVEVHFGRATAPGGFAWAVPVRREAASFARIGLMCDRRARHHFEHFVERIGPRWEIEAGTAGAALEPRLKMLPLAPLPRTHRDRVLAVGDAAGLVKATTGGGIYYSLVSARVAAEVLDEALGTDRLADKNLRAYERGWNRELGPELQAQLSLRLIAGRLSDVEIDELFDLAQSDGIMPIVRRTARFNEHRELILSLLKHPPARRVFLRRLTNWREVAAL